METLRRSRIELEVRVKELETRAEEAEASAKERESAAQKAAAKLEKYKASLQEHRVSRPILPHFRHLHRNFSWVLDVVMLMLTGN